MNHRLLNSGEHPDEFFRTMWRTIALGQVWKGEICNRAKDGTLHWVDTTLVPVIDDETGQVERYLAIRFDVSEKRRLLHSLQWRVGHDVLTGLPNRTYLSDLLDQALAFSRAENLPWQCACSTSMASRRSMMAMVTPVVIGCWWRSPGACAVSCVARMWWRGWGRRVCAGAASCAWDG